MIGKAALIQIGTCLLALVGVVGYTCILDPTESAIKPVIISLGIEPFLPCTHGQAVPLTASTQAAAKQALVDRFVETYAPNETSHSGLLASMEGIVDENSAASHQASGRYHLCQLKGGIDNVVITAYSVTGTSATMTLHYHTWQHLVGTDSTGKPFDYVLNSVEARTERCALINGQWLVTERGSVTFLSGAP